MTKNMLAGVCGCLALMAVAVTGCTYPGDAPIAEPVPTVTVTAAPDSPAEADVSDDAESTADVNDGDAAEEDESSGEEVDLAPESGVQYLHAVQAFSPLLESWVVDQDGGSLSYMRYTCLGRLDDGGTGAIAPYRGDKWQVTWDGDSPLRLTSGATERVAITDRALVLGTESATSSTEIELQKFIGMCQDAGETIASFVLN
ncbi:hypothetical protein ACWGJP_10550 [Microbacterium sp. NPDC055903]